MAVGMADMRPHAGAHCLAHPPSHASVAGAQGKQAVTDHSEAESPSLHVVGGMWVNGQLGHRMVREPLLMVPTINVLANRLNRGGKMGA